MSLESYPGWSRTLVKHSIKVLYRGTKMQSVKAQLLFLTFSFNYCCISSIRSTEYLLSKHITPNTYSFLHYIVSATYHIVLTVLWLCLPKTGSSSNKDMSATKEAFGRTIHGPAWKSTKWPTRRIYFALEIKPHICCFFPLHILVLMYSAHLGLQMQWVKNSNSTVFSFFGCCLFLN